MRVTVAIITRNRAAQLRRCLKSLCRQINKNFEVLVVDNGSLDNTKQVVEYFKKELKIRYDFEKKPGAPYARNKVLRIIKGDVMATIDDDCEAFPDWIEQIMNSHKKYLNAIAVQGWSVSLPKTSSISIISQFILENAFRENVVGKRESFLNQNFLNEQREILILDAKNASFKLSALKHLKLTFNTNRKQADDFEFSKQLLAKSQKIIFDPKIMVYHWERPTLKQFLRQRLGFAIEIGRTRLNFPDKLFPNRIKNWWVKVIINFLIYIFKTGNFYKKPALIPLFFFERSLTLCGRLYLYIDPNRASKSL